MKNRLPADAQPGDAHVRIRIAANRAPGKKQRTLSKPMACRQYGKIIRPTIGSTKKSSAALRKSVAEKRGPCTGLPK